jgi:hypothetical protein
MRLRAFLTFVIPAKAGNQGLNANRPGDTSTVLMPLGTGAVIGRGVNKLTR